MNIYVGNLRYSITEDELRQLFEKHGSVDSVKIIKDKVTGNSKGFGFVEMPDSSEANSAIKALNGVDMAGRNLRINEAHGSSQQGSSRTR